MVFSSLFFLTVFLPLTILLYYLIPSIRWKNILLLLASLIFYAWGEPRYVILILLSILVNYVSGCLIGGFPRRNRVRSVLTLAGSVIFNLGLLVYFKYFTFLADSVRRILGLSFSVKDIALPIGISFFTFQGLSYVIDVYRDTAEDPSERIVQRNLVSLALYIAMFPQLIAGPIVRYHDIQPYLNRRTHSVQQFSDGIEIFIIGLAKKVLLANILGETVTLIMEENAQMINAPIAWLGVICYSLQLFYDFSGYSEMAIGLGKMFGFEFQINFNYPYISRSVSEFWRRWHMSLSQWFRDYLYIPLGGSRTGNVYVNLFIVFLATGIWHGAAVGFILWGMWHGLFVILERYFRTHRIIKCRIPGILQWLYTMFVAAMGWTMFRIVGVSDSLRYYAVMFGLRKPEFVRFGLGYYLNRRLVCVLIAACLACVPWKEVLKEKLPGIRNASGSVAAVLVRRAVLILLFILSFLFIANSTYNPFIYFRF